MFSSHFLSLLQNHGIGVSNTYRIFLPMTKVRIYMLTLSIMYMYTVYVMCMGHKKEVHEQSIQEMLRKARQQQQHNRKAKQHNATRPKQSFFKEKLAASGGTRTHDHQLTRRCSYQLSYRGSSAGWAESCIQILKHLNLINR